MKSRHKDFEDAIRMKRNFPNINELIKDNTLDKHLRKFGGREVIPKNKLTLGTALLSSSCVAKALEEQLSCMLPFINSKGKLSKNLCNDSDQFLNTMSELGLAVRLKQDGWSVKICEIFYKEKDVDVLVSKDNAKRFIEVTNLTPEPSSSYKSVDGFMPMPGSTPLDPKLVNKVVTKYRSKFKDAIDDGWSGEAWIALDIAKKDELNIDLTFRTSLTGQKWWMDCIRQITAECPRLAGVLYYWYSAEQIAAEQIIWTPVSNSF